MRFYIHIAVQVVEVLEEQYGRYLATETLGAQGQMMLQI